MAHSPPVDHNASVTDLSGRCIVMTGRFASMPRDQAAARLEAIGASVRDEVDDNTDVLVVGLGGWPLSTSGEPTRALATAQSLVDQGEGPDIVDEREFLTSVGLAGPEVSAHYTADQLARILKVPRAQLRAWVRAGLIRPTRVVRRVWTFDFRDVASARSLMNLLRSGASPAALSRSLTQLERWLPDARRSLSQLTTIERCGDVLIRMPDGRLAEPSGQLRLFEPGDEELTEAMGSRPLAFASPDGDSKPGQRAEMRDRGEDPGLIDAGLALERAGRLAEAASVYRTALREFDEDQAEIWFNLGNVLYALGRTDEAVDSLRRATDLDPCFVESWNNLGNALAEAGRSDEAIGAWKRALAIDPSCADAHFNLAEELVQAARLEEAEHHAHLCIALLPKDAPEVTQLRESLAGLRERMGG